MDRASREDKKKESKVVRDYDEEEKGYDSDQEDHEKGAISVSASITPERHTSQAIPGIGDDSDNDMDKNKDTNFQQMDMETDSD